MYIISVSLHNSLANWIIAYHALLINLSFTKKLFNLFFSKFFPKACQNFSQFCRRYSASPVSIKNSEKQKDILFVYQILQKIIQFNKQYCTYSNCLYSAHIVNDVNYFTRMLALFWLHQARVIIWVLLLYYTNNGVMNWKNLVDHPLK